MAEEVIQVFKADISDYDAKFASIENKVAGVGNAATATGEKTKQAFKGVGEEADKTAQKTSALGQQFENLGKQLIAAFAVERVIAFGKSAFLAFAQAEQNAKKLQVAVGVNGGLQKDFEKLINQSKELQDVTIFSDDSIQNAQTLALQAQLTSDQVEKLIPIIADFASATGQDLNTALESVLRGLEGQGRGLKLYGINVDSAADKATNLEAIEKQLNDRFAGQAEIIGNTQLGQLKRLGNAYDEIKESIGGALSVTGTFIAEAVLASAAPEKFLELQAQKGIQKANETAKKLADIRAGVFSGIYRDKELSELEKNLQAASDLQIRFTQEGNKKAAALQLESIRAINAEITKREIELTQNVSTINDELLKRLAGKGFKEAKDELDKRAAAAKKAADENIKTAEKEAADILKAKEEAAAFIEKVDADNFKLAEDNLDKFHAEQITLIEEQNITREEKEKAFASLELEILKTRRQNYLDYGKDVGDIDLAIANKKTAAAKTEEQKKKEAFDKDNAERAAAFDKELEDTEDKEKKKRAIIEQSLALAQEAADIIFSIGQEQRDAEIELLEERQDEQSDAFDAEEEALENAHNRRLISDKDFEESFSIARSTVSAWRNDKLFSYQKMVPRLAEHFNVPTDYLLGKSDIKNKPVANIGNELSNEDFLLLQEFLSLTPEKRKFVLEIMHSLNTSGGHVTDK